MSVDNIPGDALYTPRRVQKCLFGSAGSSTKKSVRKIQKDLIVGDILSEEESDLGPMSPLALTDASSCNSSPRNLLLSPCTTPKTSSSSCNMYLSWDQLSPSTHKRSKKHHTPLRSTLKKLTQNVRHSPQQKILPDSPKSLSNSPLKSSSLWTPKMSEINASTNKAVPGTPDRHFGKELQNNVIETPYKHESPENKLITPLTSENKTIPLPKLHRRKSLGVFDTIKNSSPKRKENTLKRRAFEELENTAKLVKTDDSYLVPKARAALFQDRNYETKLKNLTLSTKSFYNNNSDAEPKKRYRIIYKSPERKRQRKSFSGQTHYSRRSMRRHTVGGINGGVSHGIRKPKPKANLDTTKTNEFAKDNTTSFSRNIMDMQKDFSNVDKIQDTRTPGTISMKRSPSPEIDLNKRFFKIKRTSKRHRSAIVTINNNVNLKVALDDKVALNQENLQSVEQAHKRAKLMDISFDTADLTVDEPDLEATIEQHNVANILKALEDDWADDEYDTMEILTNRKFGTISPLKPVAILKDVTMSPASELSNMTSCMNIKDISTPITLKNISLDDNENNVKENGEKYYPLFNKGYSVNKLFEEVVKKPMHTTKGNINWQLSVKQNGGENQYQLDAGQKKFGAVQCTECGVVYQSGDPEDENAHLNYHNNRKSLKFPGWKTERIIMEDPITSSRVILIEPGDPKQCWNKITEVLMYVDRDLGLTDMKLSDYVHKKVYLYVRDKIILGVLVAEHINTAHRMIPELLELDCCTAESTPAKCGINVVWTDMKHRKQGIASKLVDILRAQFFYGYIMSLDDIAFSIPTPSGKIFAEKYTKTRNFKVYS